MISAFDDLIFSYWNIDLKNGRKDEFESNSCRQILIR